MKRIVAWWTTPVPLARVALFRTVVYLFLLYDIFVLVNDVVPHGYAAHLYRPLFIGGCSPSRSRRLVSSIHCRSSSWSAP